MGGACDPRAYPYSLRSKQRWCAPLARSDCGATACDSGDLTAAGVKLANCPGGSKTSFTHMQRGNHRSDASNYARSLTGLVLEPDLYRLARRVALGDLVEAGGKVFLNAAI